jgi:Trk-type K+ transport system membrane component
MQFAMAFKIIGVLLILFSSAMLPSLFLSVISQDGIESAFAIGFGATLAAGILLWLPNRLRRRDLNIRDGFLVTALFWIVLGLFGAIPLWITPQLNLSAAAAIFESISGLTTTGATVITWAGCTASITLTLSTITPMAWRYRYYRFSRGDSPDARHRWHAVIPCRKRGAL